MNNENQNIFQKLGNSLGANRTVMALSIARMGDAIGNSILIIVIPLYVAKLPSPWLPFPETVRVGLLISIFGLVNALLQPIMGALSDRLEKRKMFIFLGLVLMGLATLGFIPANEYIDLIFLRVLQGIGVAITVPASMALMADASPKDMRGSAMGIYSTMRMVGFAVGPLIGGFLDEQYGFSITYLAGAFFIILGIVAVLLWVRDVKQKHPAGKIVVKFHIFDRNLINLGIIGASVATFIMASDYSMISALENEFNTRLNQGALAFGIAFSALIISRLIFQIPLGRLSDRLGRKPLIIGGLIFMAPATLLLGMVVTSFQFTAVRVLQGIASAAIAAPAFALAADFSLSEGAGRQMSIVTMGFGLGIALGPLLTGALAVYAFILPFIIAGIITLITAAFIFKYVPDKFRKLEPVKVDDPPS
jgi:MFS family permease